MQARINLSLSLNDIKVVDVDVEAVSTHRTSILVSGQKETLVYEKISVGKRHLYREMGVPEDVIWVSFQRMIDRAQDYRQFMLKGVKSNA